MSYEYDLKKNREVSNKIAQELGFEDWTDIRNKTRWSKIKEDKKTFKKFMKLVNNEMDEHHKNQNI